MEEIDSSLHDDGSLESVGTVASLEMAKANREHSRTLARQSSFNFVSQPPESRRAVSPPGRPFEHNESMVGGWDGPRGTGELLPFCRASVSNSLGNFKNFRP